MTTLRPTSQDTRQILIDNGISSSLIFLGQEPDTPNTVITIYDTGGDAPNPKWLLDFPTIQIRSRSKQYQTAYSNLINCRDIILGIDKLVVSTTTYVGFQQSTGVLGLGKDEKDRYMLSINFNVTREPASGNNRQSNI